MSHPAGDSGRMEKLPVYQPSAFYFRQELAACRTKQATARVCREVILELERHKEWIRAQGFVPPKFFITPAERAAKGWAPAIPFPSRGAESAREE